MATFRTFRPSFWDDNYIAELSASEKLVYIYFFTNSEINNLGIARLTPRKVAFYTGLSLDEVKEAFTKLSNDKKIYVFEETVWVVNFIKNQTYTSPKIRTGLKNLLAKVEIVSLRDIIVEHYTWLNEDLQRDTKSDKEIEIYPINTLSIPHEYPIDDLSIPHEYPIDGMRNVECRNNNNNNIYTTATAYTEGGVGGTILPSNDGAAAAENPVSVERGDTLPAQRDDFPDISDGTDAEEFDLKPQPTEKKSAHGGVYTYAQAARWWNEHMATAGFAPVTAITETRKRKFRLRQKFYKDAGAFGRAFWEEIVFPRVKQSSFIRDNPKINTLDWLLKGDEFIARLNEGRYDDREGDAWN